MDNIRYARRPLKPNERFRVFERDGFACRYCGQAAPNVILHVDHRRPVSKGGNNHADNLYTACSSCNAGKAGSHEFVIEEQRSDALAYHVFMKMLKRFGPITWTHDQAFQISDFMCSTGDPRALIGLIDDGSTWNEVVALWYKHEGFPEEIGKPTWAH